MRRFLFLVFMLPTFAMAEYLSISDSKDCENSAKDRDFYLGALTNIHTCLSIKNEREALECVNRELLEI